MWKSLFKTFYRSQISSFIGGMSDYGIMLLLTEVFGVYYVVSAVISQILGAVINYTINRYWSFESRGEQKRKQIPRFIVMVLGSIVLKTTGFYAVTEYLKIDYKISRILVDAVVAIGFNYTLQRFWVFNKGMKKEEPR